MGFNFFSLFFGVVKEEIVLVKMVRKTIRDHGKRGEKGQA